jgi:hypothetical protein
MDGDANDTSGSANGVIQGSPATGSNFVAYSSVGNPNLASTFDQHLRISNASVTSGDNYFSAPFPNYLDSDAFTIEMWMIFDGTAETALFGVFPESASPSSSFTTRLLGNGGISLTTWNSAGTESTYGASGTYFDQVGWNWGGAYNLHSPVSYPLRHIALVRTAESGGNHEWRMYTNGSLKDTATKPATGAFGSNANNRLQIGRSLSGSTYRLAKEAWFDEVRISKGEKYTGSMTPAAPTAPFTDPTSSTKLFCMDSDGNETQLTP